MIVFMRHVLGVGTRPLRLWVVNFEAAGIGRTMYLRDDRAFHLAVVESFPVNFLEECVVLNLGGAADVAKPI